MDRRERTAGHSGWAAVSDQTPHVLEPIIIRCGRCGTRLCATVDDLQDYFTADCEACADHGDRRLVGRIAIVAAATPSRRHGS